VCRRGEIGVHEKFVGDEEVGHGFYEIVELVLRVLILQSLFVLLYGNRSACGGGGFAGDYER